MRTRPGRSWIADVADAALDVLAFTDDQMQDASYKQLRCLELALRFRVLEDSQRLQVMQDRLQQVQDRLKGWQRPDSDSTDRTAS